MSNEKSKELDPTRASGTNDERTQSESTIEDLSPNDGEANNVRGGALPPEDLRLGVLPPDGKPGIYVLPPET